MAATPSSTGIGSKIHGNHGRVNAFIDRARSSPMLFPAINSDTQLEMYERVLALDPIGNELFLNERIRTVVWKTSRLNATILPFSSVPNTRRIYFYRSRGFFRENDRADF